MAKKRRRTAAPAPRSKVSWRAVAIVGAVLGAIAVVAALLLLNSGGASVAGPQAWSTLGTSDVHSLAFDDADPDHLYFGHHNGLLETRDGGRTWSSTGLRNADAMNVARGEDGFLQIAGHDVYKESADGGRTWSDVPSDLPGLDLHAFARDPADTAHAWAFAVGFGLFETTDRGRHWELRQPGNWGALTAFRDGGRTALIAVSESGVGRSSDGGRAWTALGQPAGRVASLAAAPDGSRIYAGTTEGVSRSTDGGGTWIATALRAQSLTVAVFPLDPNVVAVVDDKTRFFRSPDGGETWPGP